MTAPPANKVQTCEGGPRGRVSSGRTLGGAVACGGGAASGTAIATGTGTAGPPDNVGAGAATAAQSGQN